MCQKEIEHKCYLWARANFDEMRRKLHDHGNDFINSNNAEILVEQLWCSFRDHLLNTLDEFVPFKIVQNNRKQPWITRSIKQLSRRKQNCYNKAKATKSAHFGKIINPLNNPCRENVGEPTIAIYTE